MEHEKTKDLLFTMNQQDKARVQLMILREDSYNLGTARYLTRWGKWIPLKFMCTLVAVYGQESRPRCPIPLLTSDVGSCQTARGLVAIA